MARRRRTPAAASSSTTAGTSAAAAPSGACPCGLPGSYEECCGRLHRGEAAAPTAERLMRSRYSAFVVRDAGYLLRTWHPSTRPARIDFDPELRWRRLEIIRTTDGTPFNTEGTVEFRAHFTRHGQAGELHETSRFVRHAGAWVYRDGVVDATGPG